MARAKRTGRTAAVHGVTGRRLSARERWAAVLRKFMRGLQEPQSKRHWAPAFETASRSTIRAIQEEKLAAMLPYLYEQSPFYRAKFRAAKLRPADIRSVDDLLKFPITTKQEMTEDVQAHRPWGTYTPIDDRVWRESGWMVF